MIVVPKGVDHKPTSEEECQIMLVEPKGILNTGNVKGDLTAPMMNGFKMISVYIKFIWMIFYILIFFIVRSVHSETMDDLIWEKGIYYKKNTNIPFSGEIRK